MSSLSVTAAKAAILVVDNETSSLDVLTEELQTRYGREYRLLAAPSPDEALDHLRLMADAGEEVALILADQWLLTTSGVELLVAAHHIHPIARRGLLIAWGDRSTAGPILQAAALGRIDYYVAKPVFTPDERFHRAVTEFLDEWWRLRWRWFEVFRIVGEVRSARSHELRDVLYRIGLPFGFYAADSDEGRAILEEVGAVDAALPLVIMFDGRVLHNPTNSQVADARGSPRQLGNRSRSSPLPLGGGPAPPLGDPWLCCRRWRWSWRPHYSAVVLMLASAPPLADVVRGDHGQPSGRTKVVVDGYGAEGDTEVRRGRHRPAALHFGEAFPMFAVTGRLAIFLVPVAAGALLSGGCTGGTAAALLPQGRVAGPWPRLRSGPRRSRRQLAELGWVLPGV